MLLLLWVLLPWGLLLFLLWVLLLLLVVVVPVRPVELLVAPSSLRWPLVVVQGLGDLRRIGKEGRLE